MCDECIIEHKSPLAWKSYTVTKPYNSKGRHYHDLRLIIELTNFKENAPLLKDLLQYINQLSSLEASYVTGRPPFSKKSLLKCLSLKTYFSIPSNESVL